MSDDLPDNDYHDLLSRVADEIRSAQATLVRRTNSTVIELYWRIGTAILARQVDQRYGSRVIERLATDLAAAFPGQRGFSPRNLRYMRAFAIAWPDEQIVQNLLHNLPWGHIQLLLDRLDETPTREWYAQRAIEERWTHGLLLDRLNAQLHTRQGTAPSNFPPDSAGQPMLDRLATDPYRLDFVHLEPGASERDLETALVEQITKFLQHLGRGFAYMGRQYRLEIGGDEFFLDLLFYNTHLHRYVVFELKAQPFSPTQVGQLGFYITAIERQLRRDGDEPTIGVLLVPDKNRLVVEYALAALTTPMTVASYTYTQLPADVQATLPAADDLAPIINQASHKPG